MSARGDAVAEDTGDDAGEGPPPPWARRGRLFGHDGAEAQIRQYLDRGQLKNGWMICGARSLGKATLAYRIARAYLVPEALRADAPYAGLRDEGVAPGDSDTVHSGAINSGALHSGAVKSGTAHANPGHAENGYSDNGSSGNGGSGAALEIDYTHPSIQHILNRAHPDLFILERGWQDKTERYSPHITVDQVRGLASFFALTSSTGRRVVIIDSADDLNRNAANALLKSLEEPPADTLILLVVHAPGMLLPTLRSRCRTLALRPVGDQAMRAFLEAQCGELPADMQEIAGLAQGCPGYALELAGATGSRAGALARAFLAASLKRENVQPLIEEITARTTLEEIWPRFERALLAQISAAARTASLGGDAAPLPHIAPADAIMFADYRSRLQRRFLDAVALHLDKAQLLLQIRLELGQFL